MTNPLHSTFLTKEQYQSKYEQSLKDPKGFWGAEAQKFLTWYKTWDSVLSGDFTKQDVSWFKNAKLNAAYNCLDRHLEKRANQVAIYWESDTPGHAKQITYAELYVQVCRFANVIKKRGVKKGDRVCIYMPMIPETVVAMLACARIGAIHSVVFAGFSPDALKTRIQDSDCHMVITADGGLRGNKLTHLKNNVDEAIKDCRNVKDVIVVKHVNIEVNWNEKRDHWYHDLMISAPEQCPPEMIDAEDPIFVLYTSGSTGKPKGILHATAGYLVYAAVTFHYVFDYHEEDIFWCAADVGWVTGHTYSVYGPLLNGATMVMFEGIPNYPDFSRYWDIVDKYKITIFYTSPTAIRSLRREGDSWVTKTSRKSLRILGTVGEPINPDVWQWYYDVVGQGKCTIVDTWWQTETGGILITPLPGVTPLKPGSASWPFFGILPAIVDEKGASVPPNTMGRLVIKQPWPGMMCSIYKDRKRFVEAYFKEVPGCYLTGDEARCDEEGYYWILGRDDDVLKISAHRIGTEEVESALLQHASVSEAAVVGVADDIKGQAIYAFVTLKAGASGTDALKKELIQKVREVIGPIAQVQYIQWTEALPKTRSGKIMRRLLRKIANNDTQDLGDTSTLADPQVIDSILENRLIKGDSHVSVG